MLDDKRLVVRRLMVIYHGVATGVPMPLLCAFAVFL